MSALAAVAVAAAAPTDGGCSWWNDWDLPGRCGEEIPSVAEAVTGYFGSEIIEDVKKGVSDVVKAMVTFWISVPDPELQGKDGTTSEVIMFLQNKMLWLAAVLMCFLIAFQIGRMVWGEWEKGARIILGMIITYFGTLLLLVPSVVVGMAATSAVAAWILGDSTDGTKFADNLFALFNNSAGVTSSIILVILLIIGALMAGIQCGVMIARGAALFVLVGQAILLAAATASDSGKEAFNTARGWIIGLVIYKLAAAAVYGVGFRFLGTDTSASGNGMLQIFYGLTLLTMGILALPATLRLTAPAVAPAAGGSGVGGTLATGAAISGGTLMRRAA